MAAVLIQLRIDQDADYSKDFTIVLDGDPLDASLYTFEATYNVINTSGTFTTSILVDTLSISLTDLQTLQHLNHLHPFQSHFLLDV